MTSQILNNRLQKEIMVLERDPPPGVSCYPKEDNLTQLEAFIKGPPDTPFEKGLFRLDIQIPNNYPFDPPQIRFVTRIYHPNIDDAGRICADILKRGDKGSWKPSLNLRTTLLSLSQLLANPNPDDPLDAEIAREYQIDLPTFNQKALEFTLKYANEEAVMSSAPNEQEETKVENKVESKEQRDDSEESILKSKPKLSLSLSKMKSTPTSSQSIVSQSSQSSVVNVNSQSLKRKHPESFNLDNSQAPALSSKKSRTPKETKSQVEKRSNVAAITRKKPHSLDTTMKEQDQIEFKESSETRSNVNATKTQTEAKEPIIESKHFANTKQGTKTPLKEIIVLSDNEDDGILHSFQLSRKVNRIKLSLSRRRK